MNITIIEIRNIVEDFFNLPRGSSSLKTRKREIVSARQIIHYFCTNESDNQRRLFKLTRYHSHKNTKIWSLGFIGSEIGGKDHSTVIHSSIVVNNLIGTDPLYKGNIINIEKIIAKKSKENTEKAERYLRLTKDDPEYDISKNEIINTIEKAVLAKLIKDRHYSKIIVVKNELSTHIDNLLTMNFIDSKANLTRIRDLL